MTNDYNNKVNSSTKIELGNASLGRSENEVYKTLMDGRKRKEPETATGELVGAFNKTKRFLKDVTTNWSN